jgi:hypothetical protein
VSKDQHRYRPGIERLEERLDMAARPSAGLAASLITPGPPGVGTDTGTLAVLTAFSKTYLSRLGDPNYSYLFDLNHNGQIGQDDAKILLRALPPVAPNTHRLPINMNLAPEDKARGPVPTNLGGVTHSRNPMILGHTVPGALIFTGTGTLDWKLRGPVLVADANGNFSLRLLQPDGVNQLDLMVVDHYGHQTRFCYPIFWLGFARYQDAHPKKT